jgi:hypothetical protein
MTKIIVVLHEDWGGFNLPYSVKMDLKLDDDCAEGLRFEGVEMRCLPELIASYKKNEAECKDMGLRLVEVEFEGTIDDLYVHDYDGMESIKYSGPKQTVLS